MSGLNWLNQIQVTAPEVAPKASRKGISRKQRNPTNADIRVFRDGGVFPSEALVAKFNLEYTPKDWEAQGFGFDLIDSDKFTGYFKGLPQRVIFISPVDRNAKGGQIDLFGRTTYFTTEDEVKEAQVEREDDSIKIGDSKSSVLTQGAVTAGKELLAMLKEVYGIEPDEKTGYIDLTLEGPNGEPYKLPADKPNIAMVPKTLSRGESKGVPTTVRREKPEFWILYPVPETPEAEGDGGDDAPAVEE